MGRRQGGAAGEGLGPGRQEWQIDGTMGSMSLGQPLSDLEGLAEKGGHRQANKAHPGRQPHGKTDIIPHLHKGLRRQMRQMTHSQGFAPPAGGEHSFPESQGISHFEG